MQKKAFNSTEKREQEILKQKIIPGPGSYFPAILENEDKDNKSLIQAFIEAKKGDSTGYTMGPFG